MENCIFCKIANDKGQLKIYENDEFYLVYDINPTIKGHILIISKKHFENVFELSNDLGIPLFDALENAKNILDSKYQPTGFTAITNTGTSAGQTVFHFHMHIIPKYV